MRWFEGSGEGAVREYDFGASREACETHDFAVAARAEAPAAHDLTGDDALLRGVATGAFEAVAGRGPVVFEVLDERLREAREDGFQAGLQRGLLQAAITAEARLLETFEVRWQAHLERFVALRRNTGRQLGKSVVDLARSLAQKLLVRELSTDASLLLDTVASALASAVGFRQITIELNPRMVDVLAPRLAELAALSPDEAAVELAPNPGLDLGSCRLVAPEGEIDCLLDDRLERLIAVVEDQLNHDPSWLADEEPA